VGRGRLEGQAAGAINSGANMNFDGCATFPNAPIWVASAKRLLAVTIPEQPGSFLASMRDARSRSITEFTYRYQNAQGAQLFLGFGLTQGRPERDAVVKSLRGRAIHRHGHDG